MALKSHEARRLAIAGAAVLAIAASAAPAQAFIPTPPIPTPTPTPHPELPIGTVPFECGFPLIGKQPVLVETQGETRRGVHVGEPRDPIDIRVTSPAGESAALSNLGVSTFEGTVHTRTWVIAPGFLEQTTFSVSQPIPRHDILNGSGGIDFIARAVVPSVTFSEPGGASSVITSLEFNLIGRDAAGAPVLFPWAEVGSDTNPETFDVRCESPSYRHDDLAYDTITVATPEPTPEPTPTPTPTPTTLPFPNPYDYDLSGAATLKTLTKGSVPLSGSIDMKLNLPGGEFTADLKLNPTTAKLTTLGFLPVTAKIAFVSTALTTGTVSSVLSSNSKVRIKLPQITLFGVPLAGGANCQTKTASNIALESTGPFNPLAGGNLTGTFAISDLTGCGFLTGLVSPLTAGKGNAIALKLTPKVPVPTPTPIPTPTPTATPTPTPSPTPKPGLKTLTYQCTYPLVGAQPLSVVIDAALPPIVAPGTPTAPFEVKAVATAGGNTYAGVTLIGARTIEGTADARASVMFATSSSLPVAVPMTVEKYTVPVTPGDLVLSASGEVPSLTFPNVTPGFVRLESISLNLIARNAAGTPIALPPVTEDSDGNPDTFDVNCVLSPANQDTQLGTISVDVLGTPLPVPPPTPGA